MKTDINYDTLTAEQLEEWVEFVDWSKVPDHLLTTEFKNEFDPLFNIQVWFLKPKICRILKLLTSDFLKHRENEYKDFTIGYLEDSDLFYFANCSVIIKFTRSFKLVTFQTRYDSATLSFMEDKLINKNEFKLKYIDEFISEFKDFTPPEPARITIWEKLKNWSSTLIIFSAVAWLAYSYFK